MTNSATPANKDFYIEITKVAFEINNNPYSSFEIGGTAQFHDLDNALKQYSYSGIGGDLLGVAINDAVIAIFPKCLQDQI